MENYLAYIDESGDPNFTEKASKTFFMMAVLLPRKAATIISEKIVAIKKTYGLVQLKSNRIDEFDRRFRICLSLASIDLRLVTIRVNKSDLYGDWFKRKQTFYKYIQRLLNHEICRIYNSPDVVIDRYGSLEYQQSFKQYLEKQLQKELFEPGIIIESAKDNEFIQVSDFIAGSIRKAIEGDFSEDEGGKILELFRSKWTVNLVIPDKNHHVKPVPSDKSEASLMACLDEAWRYLEINKQNSSDPRVRALEYLYYSALDGRNDWIFTYEIIAWLREFDLHLSEEQFRTDVTATLRDEGLIIVSSRKGLKIPLTAGDFMEYVQFSVNLALPVLKRLKKAITFISEKTELTGINELLSDEMKQILRQVNA